MIAVTGYNTTIVRSLSQIVDEEIVRIGGDLSDFGGRPDIPYCGKYVLAAGVLHQKSVMQQTPREIQESLAVNMMGQIRLCEMILAKPEPCVIVVIGSQSGIKGSFDMTYACAKAGIHLYVKSVKTRPDQRIVAVSPGIIIDSGMTERRKDYDEVKNRPGLATAMDLATTVKDVLYNSTLSNVII